MCRENALTGWDGLRYFQTHGISYACQEGLVKTADCMRCISMGETVSMRAFLNQIARICPPRRGIVRTPLLSDRATAQIRCHEHGGRLGPLLNYSATKNASLRPQGNGQPSSAGPDELASIASVLANRPLARANSRMLRGFTRATGNSSSAKRSSNLRSRRSPPTPRIPA
jgi:hypothetical protein